MSSPSPGQIYAVQREQLVLVARSLSSDETATMVPQCPAWSIRDVVAHVCGINADVLSGNIDGIGTEAWTAAQVASRASKSIEEVCDEWEGIAPEVDALTAAQPGLATRACADLTAHYHDVMQALGRAGDRDSDAVRLGLERYGPFFCERAADAGMPIVRVEAGPQAWQSAEGEPVTVLRATAFELFRAFSGRRSAAQVQAMDWVGDPDPYLQVITPYGLPSGDVIE